MASLSPSGKPLPEEVRVEVRHGAPGEAEAVAVDEVVGDEGADGSEVEVVLASRLPRLYEVLEDHLSQDAGPSEVLALGEPVDEVVHAVLTLGERQGPVLVPPPVVTDSGTRRLALRRFSAEEPAVDGREVVVVDARVADDEHARQQTRHTNLSLHVVGGEYPLAVGKFLEDLGDAHAVDEVDIALLRYLQHTALDVEVGVLGDEHLPLEAEVLLVGGIEDDMVAGVAVHTDGILDVEVEEADGRAPQGRGEGVLEQADVVVVDVHILKDLLEHGVDHVARLEDFVHTRGARGLHDVEVAVRLLSVEMLGDLLVDGDGKDELGRVDRRPLQVVEEPGLALLVDGVDLVLRECYLLVFAAAVVGVVLQVRHLLLCDDTPHELHGRVVLAAVALAVGFDLDLCEAVVRGFEADGDAVLSPGEGDGQLLIAHAADDNLRGMVGQAEGAPTVADDILVGGGDEDVGIGHTIAIVGIDDDTTNLRPDGAGGKRDEEQEQRAHQAKDISWHVFTVVLW